MAFVSFLRKSNNGTIPDSSDVALKDGQFVLDTNIDLFSANQAYLYNDVKGTRFAIADRKDSVTLASESDINKAVKNGWYKIDLGTTNNGGTPVDNKIYLRTQSNKEWKKGQQIELERYGNLFVYGRNKTNCTQILTTNNPRGYYLIRKRTSSGWSTWQILDSCGRIDRRYLDATVTPGCYYFNNIDDSFLDKDKTIEKLVIDKYTWHFSCDNYYLTVAGWGREANYVVQNLYPVSKNTALQGIYFTRRSYLKTTTTTTNGESTSSYSIVWSDWKIHSATGNIPLPNEDQKDGKPLNLDIVTDPNTYQIYGTIKISPFGQSNGTNTVESSYSNPILEVKAHYQKGKEDHPKHVTQILYTGNGSSIIYIRKTTGYSSGSFTWSTWACLMSPNGFALKAKTDRITAIINATQSPVLPSGSYFVENGYTFGAKDMSFSNGVTNDEQITIQNCRLVVDNFKKDFSVQTIYCYLSGRISDHKTRVNDLIKKLPGVTTDSLCVFRRISTTGDVFEDGKKTGTQREWKKWKLIEPTLVEDKTNFSITSTTRSWKGVLSTFTNTSKSGLYLINLNGAKDEHKKINGFSFNYAMLDFKRLGSNGRAILYPIWVETSYILHSEGALDKESSAWTEWRWENPPKIPGVKYPLNEFYNNQPVYYYKQKKEIGPKVDNSARFTVLGKPSKITKDNHILWTHYYTNDSRTIGNNLPLFETVGGNKVCTKFYGDQRTIIIFPAGTNSVDDTVAQYARLTGNQITQKEWQDRFSRETKITPGTYIYRRSDRLAEYYKTKGRTENLYIEYKFY